MSVCRFGLATAGLCFVLSACSPPPSFDKGADAYKAKDYAGAMAQWRPLADQGDARAQSNLGALYLNGQGVAADAAAAAHWYALAAAQGNANAESSLGAFYAQGKGVTQDFVAARNWLAKAAAQNQDEAAFNLAVLYDNGQGGQTDKAAAARLYTQSATLGNSDAQANLGVDYATGDGVPADPVQAYKWLALSSRGASDPQRKAQADADLARLTPTMTASQVAEANAAVTIFRAAPS
jgi:TPR repeat protein